VTHSRRGQEGLHSLLPSGWERVTLALILLVAFFLRLHDLDEVPPGLTHDEASNGHDAAGVLHGVWPIYFTVGYGHEPLYPYSVAPMMALIGESDTALRLTTVCWGMAALLLTYAAGRRLFGQVEALVAASWMAVSFWCVMTSRIGLRAITLPTVFLGSALCFWGAFPVGATAAPTGSRRRWLSLACCGLLLGATLYTYMASRVLWAVYPLFFLYLVLLRAANARVHGLKRAGIAVVLILAVAAAVASPLLWYLATHPEAEQRIDQLAEPLRQALGGDFGPLWSNVSRSLPMFAFEGDPLWLYNVPGRPLLGPGAAALFCGGMLICLYRWREPRHVFVVLWLAVGVAPALASGPDATVLRSIAAQPAVFLIVAVATAAVIGYLRRVGGRVGSLAALGGVGILLAATAVRTGIDYFEVWAEHRDVRVAYHHALVQQVEYLEAAPEAGPVAFSSIYPGRFHDPYVVQITLRRDDLTQSWFDGRYALVFPAAGDARVLVPSIAPIHGRLQPLFDSYSVLVDSERLRPDDLVTGFDVYRFASGEALSALVDSLGEEPLPCLGSPVPDLASCRVVERPVHFGEAVDLIAHRLLVGSVGPGDGVEVLTVWRVQQPIGAEAVVFVHLLGADGTPLAQSDRLDAPSWSWREGDAFAQLSSFLVPAGTPAGRYCLEVGVYAREDLSRLPIVVEGELAGDSVLIEPVDVVVDE
jgi:4-amino-4-deoxy-L-arabinose transferase-like glycosyltransferase